MGDYPIVASSASDANYTITFVAGTLTVTAPPMWTVFWPLVVNAADAPILPFVDRSDATNY